MAGVTEGVFRIKRAKVFWGTFIFLRNFMLFAGKELRQFFVRNFGNFRSKRANSSNYRRARRPEWIDFRFAIFDFRFRYLILLKLLE